MDTGRFELPDDTGHKDEDEERDGTQRETVKTGRKFEFRLIIMEKLRVLLRG